MNTAKPDERLGDARVATMAGVIVTITTLLDDAERDLPGGHFRVVVERIKALVDSRLPDPQDCMDVDPEVPLCREHRMRGFKP